MCLHVRVYTCLNDYVHTCMQVYVLLCVSWRRQQHGADESGVHCSFSGCLCLVCVQHRSMHVCAALSCFHVCVLSLQHRTTFVVSLSRPRLASARRGSLASLPASPCSLIFRPRVRSAEGAGSLRSCARVFCLSVLYASCMCVFCILALRPLGGVRWLLLFISLFHAS